MNEWYFHWEIDWLIDWLIRLCWSYLFWLFHFFAFKLAFLYHFRRSKRSRNISPSFFAGFWSFVLLRRIRPRRPTNTVTFPPSKNANCWYSWDIAWQALYVLFVKQIISVLCRCRFASKWGNITVLSRYIESLFEPTRKSSPWGNFSKGGSNQSIKRRLSL